MADPITDAARQRALSTMTRVLERELGALLEPTRLRAMLDDAAAEVAGHPDPARALRLRVGARALEALSDGLDASARASQLTVQVPLAMVEPRPERVAG